MKPVASFLLMAAAFASGQQQPPPAVRTATTGVLVDVTVVDKDGHPVTDLTSADFEVNEDGKPQQILSATLMQGGIPSRVAHTGATPTTLMPSTTSPAPAANRPPVPTVTAILFDSLSADARPFATKAAVQFVTTMAMPSEYAGVFQSGLTLVTVQPFTNRTADLRVRSIAWRIRRRTISRRK